MLHSTLSKSSHSRQVELTFNLPLQTAKKKKKTRTKNERMENTTYQDTCIFMLELFMCNTFLLKFLDSWADYKKLMCVQLFSTCMKGETGEAAKTLLYLKLPCL